MLLIWSCWLFCIALISLVILFPPHPLKGSLKRAKRNTGAIWSNSDQLQQVLPLARCSAGGSELLIEGERCHPKGLLNSFFFASSLSWHFTAHFWSLDEFEEPISKSKICANVFCGAGRECAVTEKTEPTCLCIEKCKPHKRPVCGSNGKTYLNHCELHRDACLTGSKIQVDYDGHCKEKQSKNSVASPVVCYQTDRDELRRRVIQWLEAEIIPDGWFAKGSNYTEILDKYFKNFDDGDSRLDSNEFLKFVEQNETAVNITTYMNQETNKLLRGLCVDALIELSDENADWKLSFNEFLKCLNPAFNPPEKKCALEDETYEDGAETQVECNRCVCACGNWVCTAMTCEDKNHEVPPQGQRTGDNLTEEELARYVQELQKHQETSEKVKQMATKEM